MVQNIHTLIRGIDVSDQMETIVTRLGEAYAIAELLAENFESSKRSEAEKTKAFALTGDLINIVCAILRDQIQALLEIFQPKAGEAA